MNSFPKSVLVGPNILQTYCLVAAIESCSLSMLKASDGSFVKTQLISLPAGPLRAEAGSMEYVVSGFNVRILIYYFDNS